MLSWSRVTHLPSFLPSQYQSPFICPRRDGTRDWLESCPVPLSCPPFMSYATGISSWLVYTFWKLAWHSLNIAKQTLCVYCHVNLIFCGWLCVLWGFFCVFFFCPPQVNQHQTKVVPCKKVHLTVQAFWRVFPFPWRKSLSCLWKETFLVPYLIKNTVHCSVPRYLSPGAHLSLLKPEHQKDKGTLYVSGYQVPLTSRFTLHVLPINLESTSVQNKVSVSRQHNWQAIQFYSWMFKTGSWHSVSHIALLYHFLPGTAEKPSYIFATHPADTGA